MNTAQTVTKGAEKMQKGHLKSQEKQVDYYERAKRLEEIPFLEAHLKVMQLQDEIFWEQHEKDRIETAIAKRRLTISNQQRLARMKTDKDCFLDKFAKERSDNYEIKLRVFEKHLTEERNKRLAERKKSREEERRARWIKEKQDEKERKKAEERKNKYAWKNLLAKKEEQEKLEKEKHTRNQDKECKKGLVEQKKSRREKSLQNGPNKNKKKKTSEQRKGRTGRRY